MKKFISLLLCSVLLLVPVTAFAAEYPAETLIRMGDVNLDGKINASDARLALRMSASLESSADTDLLSVDADGNGKISSADARLILRKAAGLAEFTYGFDGNGVANSLKALKSSTFILSVDYEDVSFRLVKQGNNIHIVSSDLGEDMAALGMEDCGLLFCNDEMYLSYVSGGVNVAMFIPESMYDDLGMSKDDVFGLADSITSMFPDEFGTPEKKVVNGETMYVYNINEPGMKSNITVDAYGIIKTIDSLDSHGNTLETIVISEVNAVVSADYFTLSDFELI